MNILSTIKTVDDFNAVVAQIQAREDYVKPAAFAIGLAYVSKAGKTLAVRYPHVNFQENFGAAAVFHESLSFSSDEDREGALLAAFEPFENDGKTHANILALRAVLSLADDRSYIGGMLQPVVTFIHDLSAPPVDAADVILRLHLLSHRKIKPHEANLDGTFAHLTNVCWTAEGPIDAEEFEQVNLDWMIENGYSLDVYSVDKFPPMLDYVVPSGVRIADGNRVRLGAYLAPGTTVMHEGFVNFNAGTLGKSMVEGRISAGVVVGAGTDVGGGASIMGTLSGGGTEVIVIGERCLLGANSGTGISLGNDCKVEAGLYITAGMPVCVLGQSGGYRRVKARDLSGCDGLTFRRNGTDGAVEVVPTKGLTALNEALHSA